MLIQSLIIEIFSQKFLNTQSWHWHNSRLTTKFWKKNSSKSNRFYVKQPRPWNWWRNNRKRTMKKATELLRSWIKEFSIWRYCDIESQNTLVNLTLPYFFTTGREQALREVSRPTEHGSTNGTQRSYGRRWHSTKSCYSTILPRFSTNWHLSYFQSNCVNVCPSVWIVVSFLHCYKQDFIQKMSIERLEESSNLFQVCLVCFSLECRSASILLKCKTVCPSHTKWDMHTGKNS